MRYRETSFCKSRAMRHAFRSQLKGMPLGTSEERDARKAAYENMAPAQRAYEDLCWDHSTALSSPELGAPLVRER